MIRDINEEAAEQLATVNASLLEEVARLRARIEKLEGALQEVADKDPGQIPRTPFDKYGDMRADTADIARAALEDKEC